MPNLPPSDQTEPTRSTRAPAAGRLQRWWDGRYGYRMALEIALVVALLSLYRYTRYLAREQTGAAFANAGHVLRLENVLGIDNEKALQRAALDHLWLIRGLNRYYVSVHFPATVGFFVFMYVRAPAAYRRLRRLFVAVTGMALVIHIVFPLAPPRMLPGYVDTIDRYGPAIYQRSDVAETANQFAAMPSLHFGWAVLVAYGVVHLSRSRWRWIAVAHPVLILVAIVLTANHYWLDAIVAGLLVLGAMAASRALARPGSRPDRPDRAPSGPVGAPA